MSEVRVWIVTYVDGEYLSAHASESGAREAVERRTRADIAAGFYGPQIDGDSPELSWHAFGEGPAVCGFVRPRSPIAGVGLPVWQRSIFVIEEAELQP